MDQPVRHGPASSGGTSGARPQPFPLAAAPDIAMLGDMTPAPAMPPAPRIVAVDLARTAALAGMALFHLVFDLELFGHLPAGTVAMPGGWAIFARLIAGSFLFLAGVSLVLAHGNGIRWPAFLRRLAVVASAALAVTLGTYAVMPGQFVFFGILHAIAAFSVLGLAVLRLPVAVTVALAGAVAMLPGVWTGPAFDAPALLWLGLSTVRPTAMDFEPLFPWFAPFLAGMAAARLADRAGVGTALSRPPGPLAARLAWPGRHSLAIYLVHQPVLLGLVWLATQLLG